MTGGEWDAKTNSDLVENCQLGQTDFWLPHVFFDIRNFFRRTSTRILQSIAAGISRILFSIHSLNHLFILHKEMASDFDCGDRTAHCLGFDHRIGRDLMVLFAEVV